MAIRCIKIKKMKQYKGRSVLDTINSITINKNKISKPYLSVQHIHRPNRLIRNYLGDLCGS